MSSRKTRVGQLAIVGVLVTAAVIAGAQTGQTTSFESYDGVKDDVLEDDTGTSSDEKYARMYSNAAGDGEVYSANPDDHVFIQQSLTFGFNYSSSRCVGCPWAPTTYTPTSRDHRAVIDVGSVPDGAEVTLDPIARYDNYDDDVDTGVVEASIEFVIGWAAGALEVPDPSAFLQLAQDDSGNSIEKSPKSFTVNYGDHPKYQGVYWKTSVSGDVQAGMYYVDADARADVGYYACPGTGCAFTTVDENNLVSVYTDFEVYRDS